MRRRGARHGEVLLREISAHGCSVELAELVEERDHVIARLPKLEPFGATVAWVDGRSAGLHFNRGMHPAVFELLLTRLR
jgi:hypothetical protein